MALYAITYEQVRPVYVSTSAHRVLGSWLKGLTYCSFESNGIEVLEKRRDLEDCIQIKSPQFAYQKPRAGDGLRRYLVDTCLPIMHTFTTEIENDFFPRECLDQIKDAQVVRLEDAGKESDGKVGQVEESDMSKYHDSRAEERTHLVTRQSARDMSKHREGEEQTLDLFSESISKF